MPWYRLSVLGFVMVSVCTSPVMAQAPQAKAKVELRWVETTQVKGLTEEMGFQSSSDLDSIVYMHKQPAMLLTSAEVTGVRLTNLDLSKNGLSKENYTVTLHLTKQARDKLAASCGDKEKRWITIVVDGKNYGLQWYVKGNAAKKLAAEINTDTFLPSVGFLSSRAAAERIVDAFKNPDQATNTDTSSPFSTVLPNGTRVELVGVKGGADPGVWWKPDGTPLEHDPRNLRLFQQMHNEVSSTRPEHLRTFVIRITSLPHRQESSAFNFCFSQFDNPPERTSIANDSEWTVTDAMAIGVPGITWTTFRMGFDPFPETVVRTYSPGSLEHGELPTDPLIRDSLRLIQPVSWYDQRDNAFTNYGRVRFGDRQLFVNFTPIAIDQQGDEHLSNQGTGGNGPLTVGYRLPLKQISRLESRLKFFRHTVSFENVSLLSGQKTDPKVTVRSLTDDRLIHENSVFRVLPNAIDVPVRIVFGDTGQPAAKAMIFARSGDLMHAQETASDGTAMLRLPPGVFGAEVFPATGSPYLATPASDIRVGPEVAREPLVLKLQPGSVLNVTVLDLKTLQPIRGVDVWSQPLVGGMHHRDEIQFRSWSDNQLSLNRPLTNEQGKLQAILLPGDYRIGAGFTTQLAQTPIVNPEGTVITCESGKIQDVTLKLFRPEPSEVTNALANRPMASKRPSGVQESPARPEVSIPLAAKVDPPGTESLTAAELQQQYDILQQLWTMATGNSDLDDEFRRLNSLPPRKRELTRPICQIALWNMKPEAWPLVIQLRTLRRLEFVGTDLRGQIPQLAVLEELQEFKQLNCQFDLQDLIQLQQFRKLEKIDVQLWLSLRTEAEGDELLGNVTDEETLWLRESLGDKIKNVNQRISAMQILLVDRALHKLQVLKHLKSFKLVHPAVSTRGMERLLAQSNLEHIDVHWQGFDQDAVKLLSRLPNLKSFQGANVNDEMLAELAKLPKLERLSVWAGQVTDKGAEAISTCRSIRHLSLTHSRITDAGLDALGTMPELLSLDLSFATNDLTLSIARFRTLHPDCKLTDKTEKVSGTK